LFTLLDLCVSSLRRGHANLLCIVPILTDDPRRESKQRFSKVYSRRLGSLVKCEALLLLDVRLLHIVGLPTKRPPNIPAVIARTADGALSVELATASSAPSVGLATGSPI
jgi:hypothetical protein